MIPINGAIDLPTDPDARIILAGEYVLGTLDARTAKAVAQALMHDADLAGLVADFEQKFAPMVNLAVPEAPPVDLWSRIESAITPPVKVAAPAPTSGWLRLWQGWAIGASLAAAVLAVIVILPPKSGPVMTTILLADAKQQAWQAAVDGKGGLQLAALSTVADNSTAQAPLGNDYQLWALAPGAKDPVSLGVLPRGKAQIRLENLPVQPQVGMLILISMEPPGGAPGTLPTGPVVFVGRLSEAGPPT
jgi:anti-sigma-K factor RskA